MWGGRQAASLAASVGLAVGVAGCSPAATVPPAPPAESSASLALASAAASAGPSPARSSAPSGQLAAAWNWTAVAFRDTAPAHVVGLEGGRLLGVSDSGRPQAQRPSFWASADGRSWRRLSDDTAFEPQAAGCIVSVSDIVRTGVGLVAVGDEDCRGTQGPAAKAWTSADGVRWRSAAVDGASGSMMRELVVRPDGSLVALGGQGMGIGTDATDSLGSAVIWTSTDGGQWRPVLPAPSLPPGAAVGHVVSFGGTYIGIGSVDSAAAGTAQAAAGSGLWQSPDAVHWTLLPGSPQAADLTVLGDLLVAVGPQDWVGTSQALAWSTRDGSGWARDVLPAAPLSGDSSKPPGGAVADGALRTSGGWLVAVGWRRTAAGDEALAWASGDGLTWSSVVLPSVPAVWGFCQAGRGLLFEGFDLTTTGQTPVVYFGSPEATPSR
jgi:hypothetical protein